MTPQFQIASDVIDGWRDGVLTGEPPVLYPIGTGELARLEVGPGLVTLVGGAPGAGKTAFTMQATIDALRLSPHLRALVCNVEMSPAVLLDRQLARLSGIDLTTIRYRRFGPEHADRIDQAMNTLAELAERLCFVRPPFDLGNVAAAADDFAGGHALLLVLDYIQRIAPPGDHGDDRGRVNRTMDYLRQFADAGVAVMVISAVGRSRDKHGRSSYAGSGLNLASFRESSELEFGADDAFILHPDDDDPESPLVTLKHLKSRHGECRTLTLEFDRKLQRFAPEEPEPGHQPDTGKVGSRLASLWSRTESAPEGADDE